MRSPDTIIRQLDAKEKLLAEALDIEPVICGKIDTPVNPKLTPDFAPEFHIPNSFHAKDGAVAHTTPLKKIHFLSNSPKSGSYPLPPTDAQNLNNLSDDVKTQIINFDTTSDYFAAAAVYPSTSSNGMTAADDLDADTAETILRSVKSLADVPEVRKMPQNMNIPSLWNVSVIEKSTEDDLRATTQPRPNLKPNDSEWELVDM